MVGDALLKVSGWYEFFPYLRFWWSDLDNIFSTRLELLVELIGHITEAIGTEKFPHLRTPHSSEITHSSNNMLCHVYVLGERWIKWDSISNGILAIVHML